MDETTKVTWETLSEDGWSSLRKDRAAEITSVAEDEVAYHVCRTWTGSWVVVETTGKGNSIGVTDNVWPEYGGALTYAVHLATMEG